MALKPRDKLKTLIECQVCGGGAHASVSKNMTIFMYCKNVVDEETGETCGFRGFLGRAKSNEIIEEYNASIGEIENAQDEIREEPAGEETGSIAGSDEKAGGEEPEPRMEAQREGVPRQAPARSIGASFFAGAREFLTGDAD